MKEALERVSRIPVVYKFTRKFLEQWKYVAAQKSFVRTLHNYSNLYKSMAAFQLMNSRWSMAILRRLARPSSSTTAMSSTWRPTLGPRLQRSTTRA